MLMFNVDDVTDTDFKSCLDCVNFTDDAPDGYCKLSDHPAVQQFVCDPATWEDADMSRCPGFVEDK
ncbi:hypothetical protein [Phormidium sp. FACHB-1136]|uniref:hypothetical protein n=1 Tax=Phormidium sp. FACHB-1136 TaxID=2692848 RepID=UPI0016893D17|nr:hypothetical protein [Phormidium sp. FACHB-1136]MBD2428283.1 hypothetical protein [Phormidium sp. FACHB-1136]